MYVNNHCSNNSTIVKPCTATAAHISHCNRCAPRWQRLQRTAFFKAGSVVSRRSKSNQIISNPPGLTRSNCYSPPACSFHLVAAVQPLLAHTMVVVQPHSRRHTRHVPAALRHIKRCVNVEWGGGAVRCRGSFMPQPPPPPTCVNNLGPTSERLLAGISLGCCRVTTGPAAAQVECAERTNVELVVMTRKLKQPTLAHTGGR